MCQGEGTAGDRRGLCVVMMDSVERSLNIMIGENGRGLDVMKSTVMLL